MVQFIAQKLTCSFYLQLILQSNKFCRISKLMEISIAQQGSGFPIFIQTTYHYFSNKDPSKFEVILEDVQDPEVQRFLHVRTNSIGPSTYIGTNT